MASPPPLKNQHINGRWWFSMFCPNHHLSDYPSCDKVESKHRAGDKSSSFSSSLLFSPSPSTGLLHFLIARSVHFSLPLQIRISGELIGFCYTILIVF
ncbi:unnamed protein product [Citrullus colocynthis]|uniref:Uncharacterized protein n=1 Tax=Citrullus colocynthis TaxID=252529 RepID=A0ABP0XTF1_9ROSI